MRFFDLWGPTAPEQSYLPTTPDCIASEIRRGCIYIHLSSASTRHKAFINTAARVVINTPTRTATIYEAPCRILLCTVPCVGRWIGKWLDTTPKTLVKTQKNSQLTPITVEWWCKCDRSMYGRSLYCEARRLSRYRCHGHKRPDAAARDRESIEEVPRQEHIHRPEGGRDPGEAGLMTTRLRSANQRSHQNLRMGRARGGRWIEVQSFGGWKVISNIHSEY